MEPFLYNGFNLATWQYFGKTKYFMERLHILEIGFARMFISSFKNFPERLLIPAAFSILMYFNDFSTKSSVTFENLNLEGSRSKIF